MKKIYTGLLILTLIGASCYNGSKCGPCPMYNAAISHVIKVKIVDKATGADLFLSSGSPYKPSDLKVTCLPDTGFRFSVDTMDITNRFVLLPDFSSEAYTLRLGNLSVDNIKVVVGMTDQKCCATTEVKSIRLNDSLVCTPCSAQQELVIRK